MPSTLLYSGAMNDEHPKSVRGRLLRFLYDRYMTDPLEMLSPDDFITEGGFTRQQLIINIHYLADSGYIELMMGYQPPLFSGSRILPAGIDLVENEVVFRRRFPMITDTHATDLAAVHALMERLIEEVEIAALDGHTRKAAIRDIYYLREEFAQPASHWRPEVISSIIDWVQEAPCDVAEELPSLSKLIEVIDRVASPEDAPSEN